MRILFQEAEFRRKETPLLQAVVSLMLFGRTDIRFAVLTASRGDVVSRCSPGSSSEDFRSWYFSGGVFSALRPARHVTIPCMAPITNVQIVVALQQFKGSLGTDWAKIICATCMFFIEGIVMTGLKN